MYEISPYATFSVPGRENRSVTTATLDYTMQFKTFGHLENEDINTIDYERSTVDFERYFIIFHQYHQLPSFIYVTLHNNL